MTNGQRAYAYGAPQDRAALLADFDLGPSTVVPRGLALEVTAAAAGSALQLGDLPGVRVLLWDAVSGTFEEVGAHAELLDAPAAARTIEVTIAGLDLTRFVEAGHLRVLIAPIEAATSLGGSSLELDALTLTAEEQQRTRAVTGRRLLRRLAQGSAARCTPRGRPHTCSRRDTGSRFGRTARRTSPRSSRSRRQDRGRAGCGCTPRRGSPARTRRT